MHAADPRTPYRRRARHAEVAAALACPLLVVAVVPLGGVRSIAALAIGVALQLAVAGCVVVGMRRRIARPLALAAILVFLISVALLREGAGATTGYGTLVLGPVLWAATHGRRAELAAAIAGAAAVYALPLLLVGGDRYPLSVARTGILVVAFAGLVGFAVMRLVREMRAQARQAEGVLDTMSEGFTLTRDGRIIAVNAALVRMTGFPQEQLVGSRAPFPFCPPDRPADHEALGRRAVTSGGEELEVTLMRCDGERFPAAITRTASHLPDGSPVLLSTIRDITVRHAHEEAMRGRVEELGAIADVARAVARSRGEDARRTICRVALDVTGAATAAIFERSSDGALHTTCALGGPFPVVSIGPGRDEHGAAIALRTLEPVFLADAAVRPEACDPEVVRRLGVASAHFQPIGHEDDARGVLAVYWREPRAALPDHAAVLLGVLADEAAVALERADLLRRLDQLARTDALTGLANRRAWEELLERELSAARRGGAPVTVAMLDLDRFKDYNDRRGHQAGDRVLREAAGRWSERLRATDVLARWGGEEFGLLLPGCDAADARTLVERLRGLLPDAMTFSAGVAAWDGEQTPEELIAAADRALYAAKEGGRDRTELAAAS